MEKELGIAEDVADRVEDEAESEEEVEKEDLESGEEDEADVES